MVGAASISAFPLFSGFVSKSMVMDAAAGGHMKIIWFILLFASAGVFHHAGIKIPFFAFFGHDSGMRPKEAPLNMLIAMGIAAFLCIFIGSFPGPLYSLLPYPVDYVPYTMPHVVGQTQLLFFSALAFTLLLLSGIYPGEQRCVNLDSDWFYRKAGKKFVWFCKKPVIAIMNFFDRNVLKGVGGAMSLPPGSVACEKRVDKFFHVGLTSVPWVIYDWVNRLRIEAGYLPRNLMYVLITFFCFLFVILLLGAIK
jgi:multicomponent Na+:H+ antiporter subunit D